MDDTASLCSLPDVLLAHAFGYASSSDLARCDRTCALLRQVGRACPFRRRLPDGSWRRVVPASARRPATPIVVRRISSRAERPRDWLL